MEKETSIINLINQITNFKYGFTLKSATLDESADFCVIEIFYNDGIILEKDIKEKVENKILEISPKKFTYSISFIKNYISEERIENDICSFLKNCFSSIYFKIEKVFVNSNCFEIEIVIDEMSFNYAIEKNLKDKIIFYLKSFYKDFDFNIKIYSGKVYKKDEKQELINSFKEEEVNESEFRKIDIYDVDCLVNNNITGSAKYIMDRKSQEENVVFCGKIKSIKSIIIQKKLKIEEKSQIQNINDLEKEENNNQFQTEELSFNKENKTENCSKENMVKNDSDNLPIAENIENSIEQQNFDGNTEIESEALKNNNYEKKLYKWSLEDFTGQITCTFLSNKENQIKLESLKDNDTIAVCGKIEEDKFTSDKIMKVHDISYCKIPENLKEFIVYKKEKPFYEFIEPKPLVIYEQDNLLNFSNEKNVSNFLKDKTFVCYDLETTGLHFERGDRIVEIGAIKIENGKITQKFGSFVNPNGKHIDEKASETTGIFDSDVENAPKDFQVLQDFYKFTRNSILIGYNNINFDNVFLIGQGKECKWNFDNPTEDVFRYAKKYINGVKNYKLGTIAEKLGVVLDNAHSAVFDALATAQIFLKIVEKIK